MRFPFLAYIPLAKHHNFRIAVRAIKIDGTLFLFVLLPAPLFSSKATPSPPPGKT